MVIDRRRNRRVNLNADVFMDINVRGQMQLMDISLSGALIACDVLFPVGTPGRIRMSLGSAPFNAELKLRREQSPNKTTQHELGAMFASMDEASRVSLLQFLRRGEHKHGGG